MNTVQSTHTGRNKAELKENCDRQENAIKARFKSMNEDIGRAASFILDIPDIYEVIERNSKDCAGDCAKVKSLSILIARDADSFRRQLRSLQGEAERIFDNRPTAVKHLVNYYSSDLFLLGVKLNEMGSQMATTLLETVAQLAELINSVREPQQAQLSTAE